MMKRKLWKLLAAAGSFVVLANSQSLLKPYANAEYKEQEYVVAGPDQCRRLLMEVVSGAETGTRQEYLITGKDYEPETLVIAQMFPDAVNISNTMVKEYREGGHRYVTCRIGFERNPENFESGAERPGNGKEENEEVHEGVPIGRHWSVGDLRAWDIGDETYLFRCIDDDYGSNSDYQTCALFLCETVIRSDVDSTESKREILTFGGTNNYKTSEVRKWLQEQVVDRGNHLVSVNTGVHSAYLGATVPGTYDEFSTAGLLRHELYNQVAEDELFLLSLEEAIKYRKILWDTDGGNTPYSHGYWLRTPAYSAGENGAFSYGKWAYVVDLEKGCIRPAEVDDGSIGIRPAFCLPQA